MARRSGDRLAFLDGLGAARSAIRGHDWNATVLGPPQDWPAELVTMVGYVLDSCEPMAVLWGDDLLMIVNDAYRDVLRARKPMIGRRFADVWADYWPTVSEWTATAQGGQGICRDKLTLMLDQGGYDAPAVFTVCFAPWRLADGRVGGLVNTLAETTAARQASEQFEVLTAELAHRLKNSMAMVHAMAQQSLRSIEDRAAVETFKERIVALGRAHDVLLKQDWSHAPLASVVEAMSALHGGADQFRIGGPEVVLGPRSALSLSMLLHELATNAAKYGALSSERGWVNVTWWTDDQRKIVDLVIDWRERGGPPARQSETEGFGSRLINLGLIGTRRVTREYGEEGFAAEFRAPLLQVQRS